MRSDNLHELPPDLPVPADDGAADHLSGREIPSLLLTGTDGTTVNLAAVDGRVVVFAYPRTGRPDQSREFGIRISVGAKQQDVLKLILGQTLILAAIGMTGGVIAALGVTRFAANLLYGISPADPATFTLIAALHLFVALVAGYFPARPATRIDPMIALRSE